MLTAWWAKINCFPAKQNSSGTVSSVFFLFLFALLILNLMRFRGKTKSQIYILWQLEYWCCAVQCHISLIDSQFDSSNKLIASAKKYSLNMFCYHRGSTESRLCECNLHDNQFFMDTCNKAHIKFMICFSGDFFFLFKKKSYVIVDINKKYTLCRPQ